MVLSYIFTKRFILLCFRQSRRKVQGFSGTRSAFSSSVLWLTRGPRVVSFSAVTQSSLLLLPTSLDSLCGIRTAWSAGWGGARLAGATGRGTRSTGATSEKFAAVFFWTRATR